MTMIQTFLNSFNRERGWTRELVRSIPEDRFHHQGPGDGFALGDHVRHLMQAERFWTGLIVRAAKGENWDPFGLEGRATERLSNFADKNVEASRQEREGTTFAECLDNWESIAAKTNSSLGELTDEQLTGCTATHPLTKVSAPLGEMIWLMLSHEVHHRAHLIAALKGLHLDVPLVYAAD